MKKILRTILPILFLALLMASCARVPSTSRSQRLLTKHFKKYAKEYPETIYGLHGVEEVEITREYEIHKNYIGLEAFITLRNADVKRILATVEKGPFGWRFLSWENTSGS